MTTSKSMRRRVVMLWGVLAVLLTAAVQATVVLPADLVDLALGARAIAHARVVDVEPRWTDDRRRIETLVRVEVAEYFKGNLGQEVTFKVPGGQIGPYRSVFVGAPTFAEGDEVLLFLGARGPSIPYVLGLSQGVFRVVVSATGEKVVLPPALLRTADVQTIRRGDPGRRPVRVADFGSTVRALLAERDQPAADRLPIKAAR